MGRTFSAYILVLCLCAAANCIPAQAAPPAPTYPDVTFATVEGQPLKLDLYLPQGGGPFPLVIWIHGGAWKAGDKRPIPDFALPLLEKGIAIASLNYRLTGDTRFAERTFPAQIWDVKGAVRFLRARAGDFKLDPRRFVCWGSSAGGHLSALLGASGGAEDLEGDVGGNRGFSSRVLAASDYFGPTCFECMDPPNETNASAVTALLGHSFTDILANVDNPDPPYPQLVALMKSAGPVNHVDASDPPFFVAHGDEDRTVPPQQSALFVEALESAGIPVEYHPVAGAGHNGQAMPNDLARAFLATAIESWHFGTSFEFAPSSPTDAQPVTFTASASGGTPPFTFSWDLGGEPYFGQSVRRTFPAGTHAIALTAKDATGAEDTVTGSITALPSVAVTSVEALSSPFRLKIGGSNFQPGCAVAIDGVAVPETAFKAPDLVFARKGGDLKAMVPKGVTVHIVAVNPDQGRSPAFAYTR